MSLDVYQYHGKLFSGSALRLARQWRGMTRKQCAETVGMTVRRISDLEMDRAAPSMEEVTLFTAALGFPLGFFSREIEPLKWQETSLRFHR